jgi:hypothetical protein
MQIIFIREALMLAVGGYGNMLFRLSLNKSLHLVSVVPFLGTEDLDCGGNRKSVVVSYSCGPLYGMKNKASKQHKKVIPNKMKLVKCLGGRQSKNSAR